jgi:glycosyltransferase involved in cell wall biosynthesis
MLRMLRDVLTQQPFQRDYFWVPEANRRLQAWLEEHDVDIVVLNQLYMYRYLPPRLRAITLLDTHNAELARLGTMEASGRLSPRGIAAVLQRRAVRSFEAAAVRSVARVLAVSPQERDYFESLAPGRDDLVPNGVDTEQFTPVETSEAGPQVLYMGNMGYSANRDAAQHLIQEVMPLVQNPDAHLVVVGGKPSKGLIKAARQSIRQVEVTGFVPDTRPYVESSRLLAVPLRIASSSAGCAGLGLQHMHDIVIADTPMQFARWIDQLLADEALRARLSEQGRKTVEERFSWTSIGNDLCDALLKLRRLRAAA